MRIERVTFTGADDSVTPEALAAVQKECPQIEWGILLSKSSEGKTTRFPSRKWLDHLAEADVYLPMLSGHLCGRWVRELLAGNFTYVADRTPHFDLWHRMQLNFHGQSDPVKLGPGGFLRELSDWDKQFIFQIDGANDYLFYDPNEGALESGLDVVPLMDHSHGQGISPDGWVTIPHREIFTGYAGGLGADNLADELKRIEDAVGDSIIWIDMETKVRSPDDKVFDLDKVRRCYDITQPWIYPIDLDGMFVEERQ